MENLADKKIIVDETDQLQRLLIMNAFYKGTLTSSDVFDRVIYVKEMTAGIMRELDSGDTISILDFAPSLPAAKLARTQMNAKYAYLLNPEANPKNVQIGNKWIKIELINKIITA